MFENIGEMVLLFWRTLLALPLAWRQRQKVFDQFFEIGNASLLMVCMLSFFIGAVIALQTGPVLVERSLASAVGGVVGISIAKELAPVMMAILIAGRIGSAMAAEIGSMRVYQEIDALRTMNINPIHYLVLPRLVAIAVALPMLVVFPFSSAGSAARWWRRRTVTWKFPSRRFFRFARHRGKPRTWPTACSRASVFASSSAWFRAIRA
jgi:phospholipid/cholesterol/gamma-HCH transport system permease protein